MGKKMINGYHRLNRVQQLEVLSQTTGIDGESLSNLNFDEVRSQIIENYLTDYVLPEGMLVNLRVNKKDYVVPMVTEEPSVVAAANNGAKLFHTFGEITAHAERLKMGQVLISGVSLEKGLIEDLKASENELLVIANQAYPSIVKRGGGAQKIRVRQLDRDSISLDVYVDTRDAMGANIVNTMMEAVADTLEIKFKVTTEMAILSNFTDQATVKVTGIIDANAIERSVAEKIVKASKFAQIDPYRATTHNKGIMNGVDAVVMATGNDWRAIQSGAHAFAARDGQYKGLSTWRLDGAKLMGSLEIPMAVATVGGSIKINPMAQLNLKLLGVSDSRELAEVIGAVGLVQNLAALKALVTDGIQKGHMQMQARSLLLSNGIHPENIEQGVRSLLKYDRMNAESAMQVIKEIEGK